MTFSKEEITRAYHAAKFAAHYVIPGVSHGGAASFGTIFKALAGHEGAAVPVVEHYDRETGILSIAGGLSQHATM
ncbi:hypothetical protein CMI41_04355 [Candidatus Pacearchaeota archaeon]|nr:hypothetical protein [Candidatus Pacearchaeota archaeon]|tara:strand:- start:3811 stop:4035 length:225 start_codon:yes stop_codon:yes gene_type:complete